jgi:2,3-bisphosphoglycerate-independent phosphoglycerate mutase
VVELTPPHDILGKKIGDYLPQEEKLKEMMKKSFDILNHHPINEERASKGLNKANSIWFWGAGTRPALDDFKAKTGMNGAMVSAVDLLKGIAVGANMRNLDVEGANGGLDTNYRGKAMAAVDALLEKGDDFAYIHVEAPDEMGHQGNVDHKIQAIEHLDEEVVKVVKEELEKAGEDFRILIGPDHPTPIAIRTHSKEPIPFLIYDSTKQVQGQDEYSEEAARKTGLVMEYGYQLMDRLLQK